MERGGEVRSPIGANARPFAGGGALEGADQALAMAAVVFQSGGSTDLADRTLRNVLRGHDVHDVSAVYRLDFIAARAVVDDEARTILQPLTPLRLHLVRASEAARLAERLGRGDIDGATFAAETERIRLLPSPHGRGIVVLAAACAGAACSQMLGAVPETLPIAGVAAGVGHYLRSLLQARNLSPYAVTFLCALASGIIAVTGLRLALGGTPGAALVAAVTYLVPGVPLINGFMDVVSRRYLMVGVQRILDATFLFFLITMAVAIANAAI